MGHVDTANNRLLSCFRTLHTLAVFPAFLPHVCIPALMRPYDNTTVQSRQASGWTCPRPCWCGCLRASRGRGATRARSAWCARRGATHTTRAWSRSKRQDPPSTPSTSCPAGSLKSPRSRSGGAPRRRASSRAELSFRSDGCFWDVAMGTCGFEPRGHATSSVRIRF